MKLLSLFLWDHYSLSSVFLSELPHLLRLDFSIMFSLLVTFICCVTKFDSASIWPVSSTPPNSCSIPASVVNVLGEYLASQQIDWLGWCVHPWSKSSGGRRSREAAFLLHSHHETLQNANQFSKVQQKVLSCQTEMKKKTWVVLEYSW